MERVKETQSKTELGLNELRWMDEETEEMTRMGVEAKKTNGGENN